MENVAAFLLRRFTDTNNSNNNSSSSSSSSSIDNVVLPYHADMSMPQRTHAHTSFLTGVCTVLVATIAFGMGIDKPDIRRIVHVGSPISLEVGL